MRSQVHAANTKTVNGLLIIVHISRPLTESYLNEKALSLRKTTESVEADQQASSLETDLKFNACREAGKLLSEFKRFLG